MMKAIGLFIIFLFAFVSLTYGQLSNSSYLINLGYDRVGNANFVKAGYKITLGGVYTFSTLTADIGFSHFDNRSFIAPSLTYNYYHMYWYVGLNTTYFIKNDMHDLKIAPQIGLTIFNLANVGYSYYLPINSYDKIKELNGHSLNVSISWPLIYFYANKQENKISLTYND